MSKNSYKTLYTTSASLLTAISLSAAPASADDGVYFSLSGGLATVDIGDSAGETAQTIANAAGQTVNYEYDQATWALRLAAGIPVSDAISIEGGYFMTGDIDIKYSLPTASAEESYSASGFDVVAKYTTDTGLFLKGGAHRSEVSAKASITIGGTAYNVGSVSASGSGIVLGIGIETDGSIYGYDMYQDVAGFKDNDVGYLYYGIKF